MVDLDTAILGYREAVENQQAHPDEDHSDCVESWRRTLLAAQERHAARFTEEQVREFQTRTHS